MRSLAELPSSALPAAGRVDGFGRLARFLAVGAVLVLVALALTPWQQALKGTGRVIAYAPLERQQSIEAPIDGRVVHWFVAEGDTVEKGDRIAELSDNDPEILQRLGRERDAAQAQVDAMGLSISLTEARIASLEVARTSAVDSARMKVRMAEDDRAAALRAVDAAEATLKTAELNLTRQRGLYDKGLSSKRELEMAELDAETARTALDRARAALGAARSRVESLAAEVDHVSSSNQANIESTQSSLEKLRADKAKAETELMKTEVRLARQAQMVVAAPRSGTILRLVAGQGAEMVKQGDALVLLVPDADARAVELYVDGNDAPLVDPGRPVRLQFEGWPAVQFVGWPSVAVGTFPGRVAFMDAHDDGRGRFRVVVVPEDGSEWPRGRYLRQGVRTGGWILLNQVTLGFELWRQFNGFPPAVTPGTLETEKGGKG